MVKARLAVAEAVGGAGDCQAGEGSRRVLGARGRATSALAAAAHGLRLALPGAFPSTTPPRLFDQPSYPLKTPRSQARRSRASASPRSRPQRSRRQSAAARGHQSRQKAVARGQLGHTRQQQDGACRRARGARSPAESSHRRCGVSRPVRLITLLRQLRHCAGQGWDRRLHAAWLAKLLSRLVW